MCVYIYIYIYILMLGMRKKMVALVNHVPYIYSLGQELEDVQNMQYGQKRKQNLDYNEGVNIDILRKELLRNFNDASVRFP